MKCQFIKENGENCDANAMKNSKFCYLHNPEISEEEKKQIQSLGGKNRALIISNPLPPIEIKKSKDVITLLTDTINCVRLGEIDIKTANCLGVLSGHLIKAFEVSDIDKRVEKIEEVILERKKKTIL